MKITSYNRSAGKRAREKTHHVDESIGVGYQREGTTGKRIPGGVISLYFDGRVYILELDTAQVKTLTEQLRGLGSAE